MIRVITYNILTGGTNRANHWHRYWELGMDYRLSAPAKAQDSQPVAILSRLPILETYSYRPQSFYTPPLLGVQISQPDGTPLTVLVTHLTAHFNSGWQGTWRRYQETRTLHEWMKPYQDTPHLLMGILTQ